MTTLSAYRCAIIVLLLHLQFIPMLLQELLHHDHRIEVPIKCIDGRLFVRLSAHVHNHPDQYRALAHAVKGLSFGQT